MITATPIHELRHAQGDPSLVLDALPKGRLDFASSGRDALVRALRLVGVRAGGRVLLPSYICGSVVAAVEAVGGIPAFYPTAPTLTIDRTGFDEALAREDAQAAVVVHYFGAVDPQFDGISETLERRGVPMIEDCAHALFGARQGVPLGSRGSAAVFSPRKSLPMRDGGIVRVRGTDTFSCRETPSPTGARLPPRGLKDRLPLRVRGWLLSSRSVRLQRVAMDDRRPIEERPMSDASRRTLFSCDPRAIASRRRANATAAVRALEGAPHLRPLAGEPSGGDSPLGVPVLVRDRDEVAKRLYRRGLLFPIMWERIPDLPSRLSGGAHALSRTILLVPVHQDLEPSVVEQACQTLLRLAR